MSAFAIPAPPRLISISDKELGSYSMPSGDAAQGALWCTLTQLFFSPSYATPIMIMLLVAFARVYYRCHWIGDTLIGCILGMTVAFFSHMHFAKIAEILLEFIPRVFFKYSL